jgi:hypothetical protein
MPKGTAVSHRAIAEPMWRVFWEGVAMGTDMLPLRAGAKVCSVAIMVLLVIGALGPANWTPLKALG